MRGHRRRRLLAALTWAAALMILAILYYKQRTGSNDKDDSQHGGEPKGHHHHHHHSHTIPSKKIWQVTGDSRVQPARVCAQPWITSNPGWAHTLHTDSTAAAFAAALEEQQQHRDDDDDVVVGGGDDEDEDDTNNRLSEALAELKNRGIRADLIRYMLLRAEGGVYTDLDTVPLRGIDDWLPWGYWLDRGARLVVGVEWDELASHPDRDPDPDGEGGDQAEGRSRQRPRPKGVLHPVQFCQWTIVAAAPGHPVFKAMISRALATLAGHRALWGAPTLRRVVLSEQDVLGITGPAAWTEVLLAHMRGAGGGRPAWSGELSELSGLRAPRLVGDVLVLPVDAFASGMEHSGATRVEDGVPETAVVRHLFRGSWREGNGDGPLC
ncbi:hypothetical protein SLS53_003396 [Cytospora paraplurivora]|uniref:Initiation-specific alpha-1,6-mannosyltransferase n=1 Tax=Cytospora paraplurivora TaxID=2898453 RepID=A0AAN9YIW3_9PEZI